MDVECVIKELKESVAFLRDRLTGDMFDKWLRASGDALALLKAQEPVEPIENAGFYYCGACKYAFTSARQKYCSDCGRAVKWDG